MRYDLLTSATRKAEDNLIDEDTALVARFLRQCFVGRFIDLMSRDEDLLAKDPTFVAMTQGNGAAFKLVASDLFTTFRQAKTEAFSPERRHAVARRVADLLLSKVDVFTAQVDASRGAATSDTLALPVLLDVLRQFRTASTERLATDAQYFRDKPYLIEGSQRAQAAGRPAYEIKRPSDFGEFVVQEYMTTNEALRYRALVGVAQDVGIAEPKLLVDRLSMAAYGMLRLILQALFLDPTAKQAVKEVVLEAGRTP